MSGKPAIQKFFNKRQEHILMFGFVNGMRRALPGVSVEKAIEQYANAFKLDEVDAVDTLRFQYYEMEKLLRKHDKGE